MIKNDRQIILGLIIVIVIGIAGIYRIGNNVPQTATSEDSIPIVKQGKPKRYYAREPRETELFPFDPNTADSTQLLRLGLSSFQVHCIYAYRAAGGTYQKKEDFARLYTLTVKDYRRLEPYIRISSDYLPAATLFTDRRQERDTLHFTTKIKAGEYVVLNTADTTELKKVPGIGSYYAREIIRHGQWLGGYVSVDQLDEIDNFPAEAKSYFIVQNPNPRRLNINKLSLPQLRRHPYINFYQAQAIIDYRRLRGKIESLDDLRLSSVFPEEAIKRLEPYVEY